MIEPGELDQLAQELGLSDADLDWIDQQFYAFLERGKGFASFQNWEKAIPELEQALHLKPLHLEALLALAGAYRGRWVKSRKKEDKLKAMALAERCLRYDPGNVQALRIINFIDKNTSLRKTRRSKITGMSVFIVVLGFLALAFGVYTWWYTQPLPSKQVNLPVEVPKVVVGPKPIPEDAQGVSLELSPEMESDAFFLDTKTVWVQEEEGKHTLWLRANLTNPAYSIQSLHLNLSLMGPGERKLASFSREVWDENQAELWPGDRVPLHFSYNLPNKDFPESEMVARLTVEKQSLVPLDTQDLVQETFYLTDRLGNLVQIDQRVQQIQSHVDYFVQDLEWAIRNRGEAEIPFLALEMEWIDPDGKVLYRKDKRVEFLEGLPLGPGASQAIQLSERIPFKLDRFAHYQIRSDID